jgi:hypothetical protein
VIYGATLPNGAKDLGGGLLSDENYGVSRFSKDGKFMLWLEKITARDAKGIPSWRVKDVLIFSKPKTNLGIFIFPQFRLSAEGQGKSRFNRAGGISAEDENLQNNQRLARELEKGTVRENVKQRNRLSIRRYLKTFFDKRKRRTFRKDSPFSISSVLIN